MPQTVRNGRGVVNTKTPLCHHVFFKELFVGNFNWREINVFKI